MKMGKRIKTFGETETKKYKPQQHKNPMLIYDVDINKTSSKFLPVKGFRFFTGYKEGNKARP